MDTFHSGWSQAKTVFLATGFVGVATIAASNQVKRVPALQTLVNVLSL
jgi:hypothetical protein